MKVKIKDMAVDSNKEPIMITLSSKEISHLSETRTTDEDMDFCFFPRRTSPEQVTNFMMEEPKSRGGIEMPTVIINLVIPAFLALILLVVLLR